MVALTTPANAFCSKDPIGYRGSEWNLFEYVGGRTLVSVDPSGEEWHHMLPFEFDADFSKAGINIDGKKWGLDLDKNYHIKLHGAGWNNDWRDFLSQFPDKRKMSEADVTGHLNKMKKWKKYKCFLDQGIPVNNGYKYGKLRRYYRDGEWPGAQSGRAAKSAKMFAVLGTLLAAGDALGAASGGCASEVSALETEMQLFIGAQNQSNCQSVFFKLHALLSCAGVEDLPNGIQLQYGVLEICTKY